MNEHIELHELNTEVGSAGDRNKCRTPSLRKAILWLLIIAGYMLFAKVGFLLASQNKSVSPIWFPSGFAVVLYTVTALWLLH